MMEKVECFMEDDAAKLQFQSVQERSQESVRSNNPDWS